MDGTTVKTWVDIVSGIITLVAGLVVALWAYTRFVLERGLLPSIQFDIDCTVVGRQRGHIILEIAPHLGYGEKGVPGVVPENALIIAEISILEAVG